MDRDVLEILMLEEDFPPEEVYTELQVSEEDYMKDIPPLPRSHATAPMWTIYSPESALSSSGVLQLTASPEAKAEVIVETTPGSLAKEKPALDLPVDPTSLQAKRHEATSPGRSPCSSQDRWGRSATKIFKFLTIS